MKNNAKGANTYTSELVNIKAKCVEAIKSLNVRGSIKMELFKRLEQVDRSSIHIEKKVKQLYEIWIGLSRDINFKNYNKSKDKHTKQNTNRITDISIDNIETNELYSLYNQSMDLLYELLTLGKIDRQVYDAININNYKQYRYKNIDVSIKYFIDQIQSLENMLNPNTINKSTISHKTNEKPNKGNYNNLDTMYNVCISILDTLYSSEYNSDEEKQKLKDLYNMQLKNSDKTEASRFFAREINRLNNIINGIGYLHNDDMNCKKI